MQLQFETVGEALARSRDLSVMDSLVHHVAQLRAGMDTACLAAFWENSKSKRIASGSMICGFQVHYRPSKLVKYAEGRLGCDRDVAKRCLSLKLRVSSF
jgi:hypothetical protein